MTLRSQARIAGVFYALVGIFGGFAVGYVLPLGAGADPNLVRWGVVADAVQLVAFLGLVVTLRGVLGARSSAWGDLMVASVVVSVALMAAGDAAALAGQFPLRAAAFSMAQVFFGLWLVPLAWLGWTSRRFPVWLSGLLAAGALAYGVDVVLGLVAPEMTKGAHGLLSLVPAAAEVSAVLYLLIRGVRKAP
jgi:hypothetical protein